MMYRNLQYITQNQKLQSLEEEAKRVLDYGVDWIQIRIKNYEELSSDKFYGHYEKCGESLAKLIESYSCTYIINDNVKICQHLNADGIHLGKKDLDLIEARAVLKDKIIGATANSREDIDNAEKKKADYIGLGPLRDTTTKKDLSELLGFEGYEKIFSQPCGIPVVAIGGIKEEDCQRLFDIGLSNVAVSSLIYNNGSKELVERINNIFNH